MVIDLPDAFSTSKNKTMIMFAGGAGSVNSTRVHSAVLFNTASITQVDLSAYLGAWATGSRFSLYGVTA
jgi:hypothetical protein